MRRVFKVLIIASIVLFASILFVPKAFAGSPHFVGKISIEASSSSTLTVSGKEAGLGNETQVHIQVTADAQCVNPGNNKPQAGNKQSFSAQGDFPVQNGKALFELVLSADISPNCSPPMTIEWTDVVVSDTEHGLTETFPGPYSYMG